MQKLTAMLLTLSVVLFLIIGAVFGLSYWIETRFGATYVAAFWLMILLCIAMFVGVLIAGMVQRWTLNEIVDFQAADDRGEVARFGAIKEVLRGQREFERDVRRAALPLARNQAHVITERKRLEDTRRQVETDADADWYALPDNTEANQEWE